MLLKVTGGGSVSTVTVVAATAAAGAANTASAVAGAEFIATLVTWDSAALTNAGLRMAWASTCSVVVLDRDRGLGAGLSDAVSVGRSTAVGTATSAGVSSEPEADSGAPGAVSGAESSPLSATGTPSVGDAGDGAAVESLTLDSELASAAVEFDKPDEPDESPSGAVDGVSAGVLPAFEAAVRLGFLDTDDLPVRALPPVDDELVSDGPEDDEVEAEPDEPAVRLLDEVSDP